MWSRWRLPRRNVGSPPVWLPERTHIPVERSSPWPGLLGAPGLKQHGCHSQASSLTSGCLVNQVEDVARTERRSAEADAKVRQGVAHGVGNRGVRTDRTALAHALETTCIRCRLALDVTDFDVG